MHTFEAGTNEAGEWVTLYSNGDLSGDVVIRVAGKDGEDAVEVRVSGAGLVEFIGQRARDRMIAQLEEQTGEQTLSALTWVFGVDHDR